MLHQPPHRKTQTQLVRVSSRLFVINVTFKTVYLRGYVAHACYLRHVVTAVHQIEAGVFSRALYTQPRGANSPEQDRVPSSAVQAVDATSKTIPYGSFPIWTQCLCHIRTQKHKALQLPDVHPTHTGRDGANRAPVCCALTAPERHTGNDSFLEYTLKQHKFVQNTDVFTSFSQ